MNSLTYILLMTSTWYESKRRLSVNISCSIKKHTNFQEHWKFKNKYTQTEKNPPIIKLNRAKSKLQRKLLFSYSVPSVFTQAEGLRLCHGARYTYKIKTNRGEKPPSQQTETNIHTHPNTQWEEKAEVWLLFVHWQKILLAC